MFDTMNIAILIGATLVVAASFTSLLSFRFGAPLLLVFLAVGLLAGEDGLGIQFDNARAPISSARSRWRSSCSIPATRPGCRRCASRPLPALALATAGVLLTAVLVGVAAQLSFGFVLARGPSPRRHRRADRRRGGLLPASRRRHHAPRPRPLDAGGRVRHQRSDRDLPDALAGRAGRSASADCRRARRRDRSANCVLQVVVGGAGRRSPAARHRPDRQPHRTSRPALYPIVVIALALATYAIAGMTWGSGFLAVYVAGLVAGNARMRHARGAPPLPGRDDLAQPDRHVPDARPAGDALAVSGGRAAGASRSPRS